MIDGQSMDVEAPVLVPQQAVSPPAAALSKKTLASDAASTPKRRAARRKTLRDITNLSKCDPADLPVVPDESACPEAPAPASVGGVEEFAQLVKVRSPFHNPVFFLIVVLACMTNVALLFFSSTGTEERGTREAPRGERVSLCALCSAEFFYRSWFLGSSDLGVFLLV